MNGNWFLNRMLLRPFPVTFPLGTYHTSAASPGWDRCRDCWVRCKACRVPSPTRFAQGCQGCEQFSGGVTLETAVGQCGVKLDSSWLSVPATKGKLFDVRKFEVAFNFFICLLRATRPLVIWNPIQLHYIVDPWFLSLSPILQPLAVGKPCLKRFPPGISRRG